MSSLQPFLPLVSSSLGKSVTVAAVSTSSVFGSFNFTGGNAPSLMVTNPSAVTLFVRMSSEAVPIASTLDVPMPPNSQRVFSMPNPFGINGVAAIGAGFGAGSVIFTPGNGGI